MPIDFATAATDAVTRLLAAVDKDAYAALFSPCRVFIVTLWLRFSCRHAALSATTSYMLLRHFRYFAAYDRRLISAAARFSR